MILNTVDFAIGQIHIQPKNLAWITIENWKLDIRYSPVKNKNIFMFFKILELFLNILYQAVKSRLVCSFVCLSQAILNWDLLIERWNFRSGFLTWRPNLFFYFFEILSGYWVILETSLYVWISLKFHAIFAFTWKFIVTIRKFLRMKKECQFSTKST